MAISKETEEWLQGLERDGGMSGAAVLELRQHFSHAKADEYVKGSALRQSDYSRNMSEVQKLRESAEQAQLALEAKEAGVNRFQTELAQWQAGASENYTKAIEEREKAEASAAKATARLKTAAAKFGIPEDEILKDLEVATTPNTNLNAPASIDSSNFVTKQNLAQTAREAALLEGMIGDLADEHKDLFGTRLNRSDLIRDAIASGKSLREFWSETYKVGAKQAELQEASINRRIQEAVVAKEAELRSTLPGQTLARNVDADNPLYTHKIFSNKELMKTNEAEANNAQTGGVSAAVAAFQAGKYNGRGR